MRVVVLGAGFGGLELTTRLSDELGDDVDVVLIDKSDGFVFGFSKLDVMFGRAPAESVVHPYRDIVKPGVRFVQTTIRRSTRTPSGSRPTPDRSTPTSSSSPSAPTSTRRRRPAWSRAATSSTRSPGRSPCVTCSPLRRRPGGRRRHVDAVQVPAGAERDGAADARLPRGPRAARAARRSPSSCRCPCRSRRRRRPPRRCSSRSPSATSTGTRTRWCAALDPERKVALIADGREIAYDLFLGVPRHHVPAVVAESGMTVDGWIPVDPLTLETAFPGVYAVGDVTSVGTPKAGVFAEGQAAVVADRIIASVRGASRRPPPTTAAGCATSSSATTRSPWSTSRSSTARRRSATSTARRRDLAVAQGRLRYRAYCQMVRQALAGRRRTDLTTLVRACSRSKLLIFTSPTVTSKRCAA